MPDQSDLQATVFGDDETFHSTFLAVTAPSATVPREASCDSPPIRTCRRRAWAAMMQWSRADRSEALLHRRLRLASRRRRQPRRAYIATSTPRSFRRRTGDALAAAQLRRHAATAAAASCRTWSAVNNVVLTLSARVDSWQNYDGHNFENNVSTGLPSAGNERPLPDRDDTVFSPRVAALYRVSDRVSVWGDVGSGFRAPTLNELYRQFSVGAVLTLANEHLGPERLFGGEAGVRIDADTQL